MSSYDYRQYFVPGYSISRHIIFSHINYYLGPYASVRPFSYRGREGYLVTAPGQPLTRVSSLLVQLFTSYSWVSFLLLGTRRAYRFEGDWNRALLLNPFEPHGVPTLSHALLRSPHARHAPFRTPFILVVKPPTLGPNSPIFLDNAKLTQASTNSFGFAVSDRRPTESFEAI